MYDLLVTAVFSAFIATLLLKHLKPVYAFLVTVVIGALFGWQVVTLVNNLGFPVEQTSLGWLLQTNPELTLIWQQTKDINEVVKVARYAQWVLSGFHAMAAMFGYYVAKILETRL